MWEPDSLRNCQLKLTEPGEQEYQRAEAGHKLPVLPIANLSMQGLHSDINNQERGVPAMTRNVQFSVAQEKALLIWWDCNGRFVKIERQIGVSERTVRRWAAIQTFMKRVEELRQTVTDRAKSASRTAQMTRPRP